MNVKQLMYRLSAFLALAIGLAIGWLASAYCYFETGFAHPIPAILVLYAIVAYDLRWWPEMAWRVPVVIVVGSLVTVTFQTEMSSSVMMTRREGPTSFLSPMADVNASLFGATIFLAITFLLAPMNKSKDVKTLKNSRSLVPN